MQEKLELLAAERYSEEQELHQHRDVMTQMIVQLQSENQELKSQLKHSRTKHDSSAADVLTLRDRVEALLVDSSQQKDTSSARVMHINV